MFDCSSGACNTVPIALDGQSIVYVSLYGTGIRGAGPAVMAARSAGLQGEYPGLDQVNVQIPASLQGSSVVNVVVTAGGQTSNAVRLAFGG